MDLITLIAGTKKPKTTNFVFPNTKLQQLKATFPQIDFEVLEHDSNYSLIQAEYKQQTDLYNLNQFKQQIYKTK